MALMVVLFIVFAVVVVSMGILSRSDMALASGRNLCLRNQSDYLAWAGLEHARAYIQSYGQTALREPNTFPRTLTSLMLDAEGKCDYKVAIASVQKTDPNIYTYETTSEAWYGLETDKQARSMLYADIVYDPNDGTAIFSSIRRQ